MFICQKKGIGSSLWVEGSIRTYECNTRPRGIWGEVVFRVLPLDARAPRLFSSCFSLFYACVMIRIKKKGFVAAVTCLDKGTRVVDAPLAEALGVTLSNYAIGPLGN